MAKLKERFFAVPDGEIYPRWFEVGEEISGGVAAAARENGVLADERAGGAERGRERSPRKTKMKAAPENKTSDKE